MTGVDSIDTSAYITIDGDEANDVVTDSYPKILGSHQTGDSIVPIRPRFTIAPRILGESTGLLHVQVMGKHKWPGEQNSVLECLLTLKMASKVVIEPLDNFQLLLHPNASANIHLSHGSGFFYFEVLSTSKDANQACLSIQPASTHLAVDGQKSQRDFQLQPKCKARVTLRATDLCFPAETVYLQASREVGPDFDERVVSIVSLGSLRLYAPSQMEINSRAPVYLRAFDTEGRTLSAQFVDLLDLQIISSSESDATVIEICSGSSSDSSKTTSRMHSWLFKPSSSFDNLPGLARINICSQSLGVSKLKAVSGSVISNVESVNVCVQLLMLCGLF